METATNYWLIWFVYLGAGAVFYTIFWRITAFKKHLWLAYLLRAVIAAIILTPWYANPQQELLAPALIVIMLDAITLGGSQAARAIVPLALALLLAVVVAFSTLYLRRKRDKKQPLN